MLTLILDFTSKGLQNFEYYHKREGGCLKTAVVNELMRCAY